MTFTVTKLAANRFLVEGKIAVIGGRIVNEDYSRIFTTKKKAESVANFWNVENVENIEYLAKVRECRIMDALNYFAARARRPSRMQLSFAF